jgi:hypothetical protein
MLCVHQARQHVAQLREVRQRTTAAAALLNRCNRGMLARRRVAVLRHARQQQLQAQQRRAAAGALLTRCARGMLGRCFVRRLRAWRAGNSAANNCTEYIYNTKKYSAAVVQFT